MPFAQTKIQPPRPWSRHPVARAGLRARLDAALGRQRLILLSAAAGFGKTSLLAQWLDGLPSDTAVAWIGCDEDDTPLGLFHCLLAALEPYDLPFRLAPEALAAEAASADGSTARRRLAQQLINALDASEVPRGAIVIDDLHRVDLPELHDFVGALLEHWPARWSLVVSTRSDPPWPLARLRAREQLLELRAADLAFDAEETAAAARAAGLNAAEAGQLQQRSGGWPVGVGLALRAADDGRPWSQGAARAADRHVADYLSDEVVDTLPASLREFLIETSVLPELSASRCAAVSGDPRAAEQLVAVRRAGLMVSEVDGDEPTLRLHDLLRSVLADRLAARDPAVRRQLLARAAASEPEPLRRTLTWLEAGDWRAAAVALAEAANDLLTRGHDDSVERLLTRFPPGAAAEDPVLTRVRGMLAWSRWDWGAMPGLMQTAVDGLGASDGDAAERAHARAYLAIAWAGNGLLDQARTVLDTMAAEPGPDAARCRALTAEAWIAGEQGPPEALAPVLARQLALLEREPRLAVWYECLPLAAVIGWPGVLPLLQRYVQGALQRAGDAPSPPRAMALVLQGWVAMAQDDAARADEALAAAEDDLRWLDRPINAQFQLWVAQIHQASLQADAVRLDTLLRAACDGVRAMTGPIAGIALQRLRWHGERALHRLPPDAVDDLRRWLCGPHGIAGPNQGAEARSLAAYAAEAKGDGDDALALWQAIAADAVGATSFGLAAEAGLRVASLRLDRGDEVGALTALQGSLDGSADTPGWLRAAGSALPARLAAHDWGRGLSAAARERLVAAGRPPFRDGPMSLATEPPPGAGAVAADHGLSAREQEVLARIAAGDSNKLIARALDLSPHTVKRHVANILDKLVLGSRGQAAAWYWDRHPPG